MESLRKRVMELMNELDAQLAQQPDPRVQKALKKALRGLNALFSVLLILD